MAVQRGRKGDKDGKIRRISDAPSGTKCFEDGELSFELTPNGSPQTGTLTIAHPDYESYTAEINLEKRTNRNGFAKEAAELCGYEEVKLRRALVRLCTCRGREAASKRERKGKEAQKSDRERGPKDRAELWEAAKGLASKEDILEEFRKDLKGSGFAGETKDAE